AFPSSTYPRLALASVRHWAAYRAGGRRLCRGGRPVMLFADAANSVSSLLPLLVFVAELCGVTLATMRTIFVSRGMKALAPLLGFFEVSIWLFAIGQIMRNLADPGCYLGFAGGFTLGNYLGVVLGKRLAIGTVV